MPADLPHAVWVMFPLMECPKPRHTWLHFSGSLALSPASLTWHCSSWRLYANSGFSTYLLSCAVWDKLLDFSELVPTIHFKMEMGWRVIVNMKGASLKVIWESARHKFITPGQLRTSILS